jgi:hypothetical protein
MAPQLHTSHVRVGGRSVDSREVRGVKLFTVGEEVEHVSGNHGCPECVDGYPEPCRCGGLIHGASTGETDTDGNPVLVTACDACGRSEDMLDEV